MNFSKEHPQDPHSVSKEQIFREHAVQHLAAIVESSDDAIISKDLSGIITSWNQGAERIFGYKAEEVIGKSITILIPQDRQNEEPIILKKIVEGERIEHYDTVRQHKDGSLIDVSLTISPIRDSHGIVGASKIARDISDRKKAEEELKRFSSELEQRVEERTKALENQAWRLRELAVELTQVEQKERRRLAEVLHDHLQQYLVAAKIRIELSEKRMGENNSGLQDARSYIDSAIEASRQLTAELRPPVLYEGGLKAGLRYLRQKMENQYHIRIHLVLAQDIEPGSDLIKVMIYQCVQELLFNTVKYAGVSESFVTVNRLPDRMIQVIVQDKGIGFDVSRIGSHDKGGFGLFSIRERLKALGGEFLISSAHGQGSSFTLNVPDKIEMATVEEIIGMPTGADKTPPGEGIVVLVADDHPIIRQSIASLLISQPFIKEVIEAGNGEEAVRKTVAANPDIVLMDINMPIMNGLEATEVLSNRNSRSKIIGLSVQGESEMAQAMHSVGAVAYFNKGDDTNRLIETIKKFAYQAAEDSSIQD